MISALMFSLMAILIENFSNTHNFLFVYLKENVFLFHFLKNELICKLAKIVFEK